MDEDEQDLEDIQLILDMTPRRRNFLVRPDWFNDCNHQEFRSKFRLDKQQVLLIAEILNNAIGPKNFRKNTLSTIEKLLITLRFCATGIFQSVNADLFHIHQATVSKVIKSTLRAIATLADEMISMPLTPQDIQRKKQKHYEMVVPHGIPNVIGFIDCTHVKIFSVGGENAERFRCRKGFFSINVQAVGDSDLRFLDVVARWPGSAHDSNIFDNSALKANLISGTYGNSMLLGDGGYACTNYLLTPLTTTRSPAEKRYNDTQILMRNAIERAFGVLKRRFPSIFFGLQISLDSVLVLIVVVCVLHNFAIENNDFGDDFDVLEDDPSDEENEIAAQNHRPNQTRQNIINTCFGGP